MAYHSDAQYHDDEKYCINVWGPFTDGSGSETPGLELLQLGHDGVRTLTGYRRENPRERDPYGRSSRFDNDVYFDERIQEAAREKSVVARMDAGDILIFSNWTIHRTHLPPSARRDRISLECRIEIDAFDPPAIR